MTATALVVAHHTPMALQIRLKPVETLLYRSNVVAMGTFRCLATDPLFRDSGPCSHHTFVFPRTSTVIRHEGQPRFTGGPNTISLYNAGQNYSREPIDRADISDWFVVADDILLTAIAEADDTVMDRPLRPFRDRHAPADPALYYRQRTLFQALARNDALDAGEVEESVLTILSDVVAAAYESRRNRAPARAVVEEASRIIASAPTTNLALRELAAAVGVSPYRLCRDFRAATGITMTRYRHSLRVRIALERIDRATDLTELALDLGYSSHSHFTSVFRREFGQPPSAVRAMR